MAKHRHVLDLLVELQALDKLPRVGYSLRGVAEPESVAEHVFHLTFLVWALGREMPELDLSKALELALIHDLAEVRFGDLPRTAAHYLPAGAKAEAERAALADLLAPLPDAGHLLAEYQDQDSREARFVSVCDKVQLRLKAWVYEQWGYSALGELTGNGLDDLDDGGFEPVRRLVEELRHRRDAE
ncbi:MAG: HD domain-containing protein [Thermoanaerobaculia bacterium]|nr:HD domain-containing protein [Thermoanaerobaculia bacterium]